MSNPIWRVIQYNYRLQKQNSMSNSIISSDIQKLWDHFSYSWKWRTTWDIDVWQYMYDVQVRNGHEIERNIRADQSLVQKMYETEEDSSLSKW